MNAANLKRVFVAAAGASAAYVLSQAILAHGEITVTAPPFILVMMILALMGTVIAAASGWLMFLMSAVRLRTYVIVPMAVPVLLSHSSIWLLAGEILRSEREPQWMLPLRICKLTAPDSISSLPIELSVLAVTGFTYWALAFRERIAEVRSVLAARPAVLVAVVLFWACVLGVLLWESFAYVFDADSVGVVTENACLEWMIANGAVPGTTVTVPVLGVESQ